MSTPSILKPGGRCLPGNSAPLVILGEQQPLLKAVSQSQQGFPYIVLFNWVVILWGAACHHTRSECFLNSSRMDVTPIDCRPSRGRVGAEVLRV